MFEIKIKKQQKNQETWRKNKKFGRYAEGPLIRACALLLAIDWLFTTSEKNPSNCCHMQDHNQCWFR